MKKLTIPFMILVFAAGLTGCKSEYDNVAPGLYIATTELGTYPGDAPLVSGTVSGYTELSRIEFTVPGWNYSYAIDLSGQNPKVFNYSFRINVPQKASFPQTLTAKVTDKNGNVTAKDVPVSFAPDTTAPVPDGMVNEAVEVVYEGTQGEWKAAYSFTDDRCIASIGVKIPVLDVDDAVEVNAPNGAFAKSYVFDNVGNYEATLSAVDTTGNVYSKALTLVVMPKEEEGEIQDWPQMYLFDADEDEADYLSGYYHYMKRDALSCYTVNFYASHDDFHLLFAPSKGQEGDLFGASPYIPSKLMNNNGYVVPVTIEKKGYYGIYINLPEHSFTLWEYDVTSAYEGAPYTGELQASGTGFSVGDWALSDPMTKVAGHDYLYTVQMETATYAGARDYYFANCTAWDPIFRCDNGGQEWFVYASGPCCQFTTDYVGEVNMYLDTALPWGWIKKAE